MNLPLFLFGGKRLYATAEMRTAVLDLCLRNGWIYTDFRNTPDGGIQFLCSLPTAHRLLRCSAERGIGVCCIGSCGIPPRLFALRKRFGLLLGAFVAGMLLWLSGRFVWDIEVLGNETVPESEILAELRECGFGVGSYIPDVRTEALEAAFLIRSDRIGWMSLYLDGTVARVQVVERESPGTGDSSIRPANLVAAADGQIEYLELYRGNSVVTAGQAVRKGELLVSGIYDSNTQGYRYTRAAGRVMARTERLFRTEVKLNAQKKVYGAPEVREISLRFFDFSLKIFKKGGNEGGICDIIEEDMDFSSVGLHRLPFFLTRSVAYPYEMQSVTRTPEEASDVAYAELTAYLSALGEEVQLLQKRIVTTLSEDSLTLECTLYCIENIAEQSEFEIVGTP